MVTWDESLKGYAANTSKVIKQVEIAKKMASDTFERQEGHHEVLDNIKIKHVSTTRYILSPRHQIRQRVSAIL